MAFGKAMSSRRRLLGAVTARIGLVAFGVLEGRLIAVVYTDRGGGPANHLRQEAGRNERENYEAALG